MKALFFKTSASLIISLFIINAIQAQEYDDVYFRKSDRKKLKELNEKDGPTYGRDSHLYDEIDKLGKEDGEEMLSEYQEKDLSTEEISEDEYEEPVIVEKHYYYSDPSTRYYQDFDNAFWNDPYLYQGNIYDPYYDRYYARSSYWRPGWNVSFSFGNRWGGSRWSSNYWGRYGYGSYGYYNSWNYDPWYYDNYWGAPYYANRGNVIVYGNSSGESRGVTRGRRSSRNSSIASGSRNSGRMGRIANGGSDDKGGRNGRQTPDSRRFRNSNRTYNTDNTTPRRSSTNSSTNPSRSNSRTYTGGSRNSRNSNSNTYRSGSRSSSSSSGYRSRNTRSSSSSSNSKSKSPSRSSRSKRGN